MRYDFDDIELRENTGCVKYDLREHLFGRGDVIPMWVADMDFKVLPEITEALRRRTEHPVYGYAVRPDGFYDSIIKWVDRRNGWKIERGWIDFTPGVVSGFTFAIRALTEPGDGIVIQPPVYHPFAGMIRANHREVVDNPLKLTTDGYEIDFDDLDRKLAGARLLLFCNPHNPTGRVFTREELERIGDLCIKHNVPVVSDEIHSDLVQKPYRHIHFASLSDALAQRTVTLIAPSKTFNLAGLSTSVAITAGDTLRRRLRTELDTLHVDQGNVFGTAALEAAYTHGDRWLDQLVEYIGGNMDFVLDFLSREIPRIKAFRSQGTYMMWLDMHGLGMEHEAMVDFVINKARLGLNDGAIFGSGGRGFMRMNLATSRKVVGRAMQQLKDAVDAL